ncbi:c2H2-type domain-containing protein [Caerostris darwini]|uniref:C2H2-type domain-containing protein n=1 Tax=Caerostris darwini TaxID=1538125 RepID=A0AAV4PN49_9ARAC|nr:c2H2-type domain-containing protein [Caerostris darwini]
MSGTFFQDAACDSTSTHPRPSVSSPTSHADEMVCSVPIDSTHDTTVDLFPSELEVTDLFSDTCTSPKFDFVKLQCFQCRRNGLSIPRSLPPPQLLALGPTTGPPSCAPFSKLVPAKTWATVAAKPVVSSSQPWAGKQLGPQSILCTTPRRPGPFRPSRAIGGREQPPLPPAPLPETTVRKHISFKDNPDKVSHAILLPSRDEHHVVHQLLEEEFNRLHGLVANSASSNFDDFVLPKHKPLPSVQKTTATRTTSKTSSTISSRHHVAVPLPSADTISAQLVGPSLSCHLCERDGFPNRKALKYHLFRVHQISIGRPEPSMPTLPVSSASSQVRLIDDASTAEVPPVSHCGPSSSGFSASDRHVFREGQSVTFKLPFVGAVQCPDCTDSFTGKEWFSIKGSIVKHLRFKHHIRSPSSRHFCSICNNYIQSKPSEHSCLANTGLMVKPTGLQHQCPQCSDGFTSSQGLRNNLAAHKKASALQVATPLTIPESRRRKRRKKKRSPVADSPSRNDNRVDEEHSLAPPVRGSPVLPSQDAPIDEEKGPLDHYLEPLEHILSSDPTEDSFRLLSDICNQILVEGKSFLSIKEPASSVRSSQTGLDIQDPQTCQKLYRRNRRRAVREIVDNNCNRCNIPLQTLAQHFSEVWQGGGPYHHADDGRVNGCQSFFRNCTCLAVFWEHRARA